MAAPNDLEPYSDEDEGPAEPPLERGIELSAGKGNGCAMLILAGPPLALGLLWVGGGVSKLLDLARAEGWGAALEDTSSYQTDLFLGFLMLGVASVFLVPRLYSTARRAQAERDERAADEATRNPDDPGNAGTQAPSLTGYLLDKREELEDLKLKDAVMSKAIVDVHRHRTSKTIVAVPLFALHPIHAIDRESAIATTEQRARVLRERADQLRAAGTLTCEVLAEHLPSISKIKVVPVTLGEREPEGYLAFEGNGRIAAMQAAFTPDDALLVEVERYDVDEPDKILRRLNRVRRMNDLPTLEPR